MEHGIMGELSTFMEKFGLGALLSLALVYLFGQVLKILMQSVCKNLELMSSRQELHTQQLTMLTDSLKMFSGNVENAHQFQRQELSAICKITHDVLDKVENIQKNTSKN